MSGGQTPLDKLKNVDWRGLVRTATNKVKQYAMNLSPLEIQVEEATNMDTWGPHGTVMSDIADACFDPEGYRQVFGVLARRLQEKDENWRMCYKALLLLEFLLKQGPAKVADDVASSMSVLERLQRFQYKDANGRDHGANVRHRAEEIAQLVSDPSRLREEREKAKANKAKYKGVSAAEMRMGGGSSGFGSGSAGSGRRGFDPSSLQRPGEPKRTTSGFGSSGIGTASSGRDFGADSFNGGGRSSVPDRYSVSGTASAGSFESSPRGHHPGAGASSGDAVAATRARIEQLKLQERASGGATGKAGVEGDAAGGKKRLTDVKVNPKIAASLGLKVAPPAQKGASGPPPPVGVPGEVDLLGGLEDPEPAPAVAAAPGTDTNGGWDAFGGDAPAAAPAPFEAFGTSPSQSASKGASPVAKAPLPEDIFADLTGLSKPMQPMAAVSSGNRPAGASLLSSGSPLATAAAGPASGSGGVADFADFSSVPAAPATQHAPAKDPFADLLA